MLSCYNYVTELIASFVVYCVFTYTQCITLGYGLGDHWLLWPRCDSLFFTYMREKLVAVYMYNRLLYVIHVYLSTVCVLF